MKIKPSYTKSSLILGFMFAILFTHLPVVYTLLYHNLTGAPTSVDGSIDVTETSPERSIVLDGKWEFYWNRLIVTDRHPDKKPDFLISVPDYWSGYTIDGNQLPAGGYGSYRLIIRGLDYSSPVTAFVPDFGSAYRIFIDGVLAAESGNVSKVSKEVITVPKSQIYPVKLSEKEEHEIVVEVATKRFSGLYKAPVLKDYSRAANGEDNSRHTVYPVRNSAVFIFYSDCH